MDEKLSTLIYLGKGGKTLIYIPMFRFDLGNIVLEILIKVT